MGAMRLIALLAAVAVIAISPAQAESNSRFDGTWIGKEIVTQRSDFKSPGTRNTEATIIITQRGTLVGIIGGFCPGRFNSVSPKGNSLNLKANDCTLTLRLSPDGKSLIENGVAERHVSTPGGASFYGSTYRYEISGTFHRQ